MNDWIKSYSQCGEDILLWRALENVSKGFYIDIGAFDPDEDSVTRIFYEAGWSGINIEPNPGKLVQFVQKRPRDTNLGIAANDRDAEMDLNLVGETGLTTIVADIAEKHRSNGWPVEKTKVRTRPLADIWDEHVPEGRDVHFLKIDVEGAEDAVIAGADWSRHRPWIVVVEALEPHSIVKSHQNWDPLLREAGYEFVNFDGLNRYYVASERPQCVELLQAPLNFITHRYVPVALHQAHDESARLNALANDRHTELTGITQELAETKRELADAKHELSQLLDVIQRRPRPLWEMLIFRRSGRPKKVFRRILFHKSGKPRGVFRKWILSSDGCPRAVFQMWMSSPEYQSLRAAVRMPAVNQNAQVSLSPDAQLVARRLAARRSPSSRM